MSQKMDKDVVAKISELAKLDLTEAEKETYASQLTSIFGLFDEISKVDVSDVKTTSHVADFKGAVLREDEPTPGISIEDAMLNATDGRRDGHNFKTSRIVGDE